MKLLITILSLLTFLVSCNENKKSENVVYDFESAINLYSKEDYLKSIIILDSLQKKDGVICEEYLLIALNNIKLNKFSEAKLVLEKYEHNQVSLELDKCSAIVSKLKTELDYSISTEETHSLHIVANLVFSMLDSIEFINNSLKCDSSNVYEITIPSSDEAVKNNE